jgi:hypothetical protein
MQMQVLSIGIGSGTLDVRTGVQPLLASLADSGRLAGRNVDTLADINRNLGFTRVGVFLALKGFDMPRAVYAVIDNPSFPLLATSCRPFPFAN